MKKIGLMGCGVVADYGHLPAIVETSDLNLHATFDPQLERAQNAAQKFGAAHAFSDSEAFFNSGLEAVAITSPAPFHVQNVLDCARHGLHVLCEKPLATDDEEAQTMIDAMEKAGLLLAVGFCYRFSPCALQIRELVRNGAIGALKSLRLIYIWNNHGRFVQGKNGELVPNERRIGRMEEGGPMVDCGVHQIDLARWWTGSEVARWQVAGAWVEDFAAPDHLYLHLDHQNGAHSAIEMSFSFAATAQKPIDHFAYNLIGTEGLIRFERENTLFELRNAAGTQKLPFQSEKDFAGMYRAFARALQTGDLGQLPSGEDGLRATQLARQATEKAIEARVNR